MVGFKQLEFNLGRKYHVVVIRGGTEVLCTITPVTHDQACIMLSKFSNPQHMRLRESTEVGSDGCCTVCGVVEAEPPKRGIKKYCIVCGDEIPATTEWTK